MTWSITICCSYPFWRSCICTMAHTCNMHLGCKTKLMLVHIGFHKYSELQKSCNKYIWHSNTTINLLCTNHKEEMLRQDFMIGLILTVVFHRSGCLLQDCSNVLVFLKSVGVPLTQHSGSRLLIQHSHTELKVYVQSGFDGNGTSLQHPLMSL